MNLNKVVLGLKNMFPDQELRDRDDKLKREKARTKQFAVNLNEVAENVWQCTQGSEEQNYDGGGYDAAHYGEAAYDQTWAEGHEQADQQGESNPEVEDEDEANEDEIIPEPEVADAMNNFANIQREKRQVKPQRGFYDKSLVCLLCQKRGHDSDNCPRHEWYSSESSYWNWCEDDGSAWYNLRKGGRKMLASM